MRHLAAGRYLNADTQHRLAMRRNLARSLFLHDRIVTTPAKAKASRRFVERLITRARKALAAKDAKDNGAWLHHVRLIARDVPDKVALRRLLAEVAPRANRPGGYTRLMRHARNQVGDNAPRAILELVDRPVAPPPTEGEGDAKGGKAGKPAKGAKAAKGGKSKAAAADAS
ncbi:MAG: 50S ribosomal protein L17 [Planctomycetes bacterium]|nr:50S ribosomal protein L17 [Planctomycetota bacterium]